MERSRRKRMIDMSGNDRKKGPEVACPVKDGCDLTKTEGRALLKSDKTAYGFKIGQRTLQMTITATEVTRVELEDDLSQALVEAKYHLKWQGITGQGMEKDITIHFIQDCDEGTEEALIQQEMMALMIEAKRRFGS
jgi:hypothetical protein